MAAESEDKDKDKEKGKAKSASSDKKGKQGKSSEQSSAGEQGAGLSLAAHPRAARRVAEAKAWGALVGFLLGGYLSLPTHSAFEVALRALAAGVVCYVVVWAAAVSLWRRLVVAELRNAQHELLSAELAKLASADPTVAAASPPGERRRAPMAS
jgi:hypothetical protein